LDFFGDLDKNPVKEAPSHLATRTLNKTKRTRPSSSGSTERSVKKRKTREREENEILEPPLQEDTKLFSGVGLLTVNTMRQKHKRKLKRSKTSSEMHKKMERANAFRNENHIYVKGADVPEPIASFQQLQDLYSVRLYMLKNVIESGYLEPTPIQMQAIPLMMHV
jgi:ATP-dependent RNA helicase DDX52/ROK1